MAVRLFLEQRMADVRDEDPLQMDMSALIEHTCTTASLEEPLTLLLLMEPDHHLAEQVTATAGLLASEFCLELDDAVGELRGRWAELLCAMFDPTSYRRFKYGGLKALVRQWQEFVYPEGHIFGEIEPEAWLNLMIRRVPKCMEGYLIPMGGEYVRLPLPYWPPRESQILYGRKRLCRSLGRYHDDERLKRGDIGRILRDQRPNWVDRLG